MVHGAWYEMRMTEKSMKTNTDLTLLSVCCCTLFLALWGTHLQKNNNNNNNNNIHITMYINIEYAPRGTHLQKNPTIE